MPDKTRDVIIIGGSVAGLSAALTLGRSLRNVLVIDSSEPCNRTAPFSHNFITNDGKKPSEIVASAKKELDRYQTVSLLEDKVSDVYKTDGVFHVRTQSGNNFKAYKILLSTGLTDILPDIPGFADCWGISILHCPYCHGYEVKSESTAILANGEAAFHTGKLISNWTDKLTILTNGVSELRHEEKVELERLGIAIVQKEIRGFLQSKGKLEAVEFVDGTTLGIVAMYATVPFVQQSPLAEKLGCQMTAKGHITVDNLGRTSVGGVYAAGDNTAEHRAISVAAASGTVAGFTINAEHVLN